MSASRTRTTVMLGLAQTLSWASSYYLPAVLAAPMGLGLGALVAVARMRLAPGDARARRR